MLLLKKKKNGAPKLSHRQAKLYNKWPQCFMLPSPSQQQHTHKWCKCLFPSSFSPRPKKLTRQRATQKKGKYKREREKLLYIQAQEIGRRREEKKKGCAYIIFILYWCENSREGASLLLSLCFLLLLFCAQNGAEKRGRRSSSSPASTKLLTHLKAICNNTALRFFSLYPPPTRYLFRLQDGVSQEEKKHHQPLAFICFSPCT